MTGTALIPLRRRYAAICQPMSLLAHIEACRVRWATSNPIEMRKEIDGMKRAGVRAVIVEEAEATLVTMTIARSRDYKPSVPAF